MEDRINYAIELYNQNDFDSCFNVARKIFFEMTSLKKKSEFIFQCLSNICYMRKKYDEALTISNECIKYFMNKDNLINHIKILEKIGNMDEKATTLLKLYALTLNNEYMTIYVNMKLDNLANIPSLYKVISKLEKNTSLKYINHILQSNAYAYLNYGCEITTLALKKNYMIDELSDNFIIECIKKADTIDEQIICILYLLVPKIFYDRNEIKHEYERLRSNLKKIVSIKTSLKQVETITTFFKNNFTYYYTYLGLNIKNLHKDYSTILKHIQPYTKINTFKKNENNSVIHVGFFSNFIFKNHSVCRDRLGVIKFLCNDTSFCVYLIHYNERKEKELFFNKIMDNQVYKEILLKNDQHENINTIIDLNLDILVFPEIGMDFDIYLLANMTRLAPIQINTWGHSETSGIDTIDYYISSKYFEDEENQQNYSEKLILLNSLSTYYYDNGLIFDEFTYPINQLKIEHQVNENFHLYGIFQTVFKYHPLLIEMITQILIRNPKSIFFILIPKLFWNEFMNHIFKSIGYYTTRIKMIDVMIKLPYCNLLRCMDIMIDSYPFGGCNTTLDSFFFDKVVLTLPSSKLNGKFSTGFYKKMGILEPICKSSEDLVQKAIYYMENKDERMILEKRINQQKHLLFKDEESLLDWNNMLRNLMNFPKCSVAKKQIVIARYKEDISYLYKLKNDNIIVYNKGSDIDTSYHVIKLPNVGKCDHTYLYHIIENYDKLEELTIFLPASFNYNKGKIKYTDSLFEKINMTNGKKSIFTGKYNENMLLSNYEFMIDNYETIYNENKDDSINLDTELCPLRPFGKWVEHIFKDKTYCDYINFFGIMAIRKEDILLHPIEFYKELIGYISNSPNPEAGHYIERSYSLMFPHTKDQFIEIL